MEQLRNEQKQVILSGVLGDGSLSKSGRLFYNSIHKEYMEFKKEILGELSKSNVRTKMNTGYKRAEIHSISSLTNEYGKQIFEKGVENFLSDLDELGLAMWFYDDASKHKVASFYNINTHHFPEDFQRKYFIPLLNSLNIYPRIAYDKKKDGRCFPYLYIPKWFGGFEVSRIMRKTPLKCFEYKLMSKQKEDCYFEIKETDEFKSKPNNYSKSSFLNKKLREKQK